MGQRQNMAEREKMDMIHGSILPKVLLFTLPVLASSFLQQLFNSVDSAVVGRFSGSMALAAVGSNSSLINLFLNLFNGLSVGANVVIAKLIGERREDKVGKAVPTVMLVAILGGFLLLFLGFFLSAPLLELIDTPDEILPLASLYLKIYFAGMPFIMIFNFGSAILRSYGDTKRPLYALMLAGIVNVVLDLVFVAGLGMSVAGVGIATVASNAISSMIVFIMLLHHKGCIKLSFRNFVFDKRAFSLMFRIGMPAGLQGLLFSLSNFCILGAINSFGPYAAAGSAACNNYDHFSYFICSAFVQAAVTFTSQNYGAGEYERCKRIYRVILSASVLIELAFDLAITVFRYPLLQIFTDDPVALSYGSIKVLIGISCHTLINFYEIPGGCLKGLGKSMVSAMITLFCCCVLRLFWIYAILPFHHTYAFMMLVYPVSWISASIFLNIAYFRVRKKIFDSNCRYAY